MLSPETINEVNSEEYQVVKSERNRILSNSVPPQKKQSEWNKLFNLNWVVDDSWLLEAKEF